MRKQKYSCITGMFHGGKYKHVISLRLDFESFSRDERHKRTPSHLASSGKQKVYQHHVEYNVFVTPALGLVHSEYAKLSYFFSFSLLVLQHMYHVFPKNYEKTLPNPCPHHIHVTVVKSSLPNIKHIVFFLNLKSKFDLLLLTVYWCSIL